MKNKYERLSKEERKKSIEEFKSIDANHEVLIKRLNRLKIVGLIGIIYSLIMFILDFLNAQGILKFGFNTFGKHVIISYIVDACLLVFCVFFFVKANQILSEQVNKYLIEKDKDKKKRG